MLFLLKKSSLQMIFIFLLLVVFQISATDAWREHDYDVQHYKIEVEFDHYLGKVIGQTTITLKPKKNNFKYFEVDAFKFKDVEVTTTTGTILESVVSDTTIIIILEKEYQRGEELSVVIKYTALPEKGLYFFSPDKGHPETPKQIWSQGEGMDNHHWFPCYDYPNDRATFEVIATVDAGLTAISNGKLISTEKVGNKTKFHYSFDKTSVSYLVSLVVGEYQKFEQFYKNIPVEYFVYPNHSKEDALRSFGRTPQMIDFFSNYTGYDYPYSKYTQAIVTNFMYSGMENISFTTLTDRTMHCEQAHLDHSSDGLVAHELAHQWWGDLVTCREWSDIWLNEGFATYFTELFFEHYYGDDEFSYSMFDKMRGVINRENHKPQFLSKGNDAYSKGASVLHMLRNYIGDESFQDAINLYAHRFAFANAETHDLRKAMEDASGINLFTFFDQWWLNGNIPTLSVETDYDKSNKQLSILVKQQQDSATVRPVYDLKLYVGLEVDDVYSEHQIHITKREQKFSIDMESAPGMVIFDAGQNLLKNCTISKSVDDWKYQAQKAYRVVDRIHALKMLGDFVDSANCTNIAKFLIDRCKSETFYGLRLESIKTFNKINTIPDENKLNLRNELDQIYQKESKSSVRVELVKALSNTSTTEAQYDFVKLFHSDPSFDVKVAALNAAIELNKDKASDLIETALNIDSYDEKVRSTALSNLKALDDDTAFKIAEKYSESESHPRLRSTAVGILEYLGDKNYKPATTALLNVVKEGGESNRYRTVSRAIRKLSDQDISELYPLLEKIVNNPGNRYVKRTAESVLKKIKMTEE